ncbi:SirB1 family protein [Pseudomonas aeruginosa]|nr:SirB1 family protein [Pseudomonas aeruginosa]
MDPRQACLDCLAQEPPALFEAALWIAAEHLPAYSPAHTLRELDELVRQSGASLDDRASASERAQGLLRRMSEQGFCEDDDFPLQPRSALLPLVLQRRQGQPLSLALVAMELARRLDIPLVGVNFPGRFLLRVPQADHLLDPATGRRLYPTDCRELLLRLQGPKSELQAAYLKQASPGEILQRLSRNLRQLHSAAGEPLAALKDAQRVIELGPVGAADHEARAGLYRQLDCPQAERYDLERALLLSDDPTEQLRLGQRLGELAPPTGRALH